MDGNTVQILISMVIYMAVVIGIGVLYAKRANKNSEEYFLGGRSLGPWVTAMSAEASDMSGWLLMGLPGVAYWCGLADAFWTAFGLAVGTYLNWLVVSKRLRRYSVRANNSITLPEFFSNRFRESKKTIMFLAAAFILIFFTVYAASCFVTCGKLFSTLFGMPYVSMMIIGASLADIRPRDMLDRELFEMCLLRLIVLPLLAMAVLRLLGVSTVLWQVETVLMAMPVATNCAIFAERYGQDYVFGAKGVFVSTVLSLFTVPLIALLF